MAEILQNMLPHLDKHLAFGLLSFYGEKGLDVSDALAEVQQYTPLTPDGEISEEHSAKIAAHTEKAQPALTAFFDKAEDNEDYTYQFKLKGSEVDELRSGGQLTFETLRCEKGITQEVMTAVMELAYLFYDSMRYVDASELLTLCQCVTGYNLPEDSLLWGKLMCDTGACNWQSAIDVANILRRKQNPDTLEEESFRRTSVITIRSRVWLLHWVLFPFFKGGTQYTLHLLNYVFDYRTKNVYQSVVETVAPHYIRYICAAALLNRKRSFNFRSAAEMADLIHEYSDPITKLVSLINKPAFEEALDLLPAVEKTASDDYFLCDRTEELLMNAKRMIFQKYTALHSVVSISFVASKLELSISAAEVWLADLISETKQRAKIDSVAEQMIVVSQVHPVEQTVLEKLEKVDRR